MNTKALELKVIVEMIIIFLVLLLVITWVMGGFKFLTGGFADIANATMNKTLNVSRYLPG